MKTRGHERSEAPQKAVAHLATEGAHGVSALAMQSSPRMVAQLRQLQSSFGLSPGQGVIQALLNPVHAGLQAIRVGLIRGSYDAATNTADLHVDAGGAASGAFPFADMHAVAVDVEQVMRRNHATTATRGQLSLHPTGAVVVKRVIELLGEARGSGVHKTLAQTKVATRKAAEALAEWWSGERTQRNKFAQRIDPDLVSEHLSWVRSLAGGAPGVAVRPVTSNPAFNFSKDPGSGLPDDMLASTPTGQAQLDLYCRFLEADRAVGDVSALTVEVDFAELPAVIAVLARFM